MTSELRMFVAIFVCFLLGGGCAESHKSGGDGNVSVPVSGPEAQSGFSASAWATSGDGKLSLRIVTAHGPIRADESVWVLAELRNDSDENLAVLKPFGDRYASEASGFETITGDGQSYGLYDVGLGQPGLHPRKMDRRCSGQ